MSADRLAPQASTQAAGATDESAVVRTTERAVLTVLTGTPLAEAARAETLDSADLAEAAEVYRRAGQHALEQQIASGWWQLYIQFTDWHDAERAVADHLAPLLHSAEDEGVITAWWFMRKHPCWRLRLQPGSAGRTMRHRFGTALDDLTANGQITGWRPGIYEAETMAFGGQVGMDLAHELFCADSRAVVNLLRDGGIGLGRRELSLLLCTTLMRAAGLEWYEQGDVWHRVAQERHLPADVPVSKVTAMAGDLKQLMLADVSPDGPLLGTNGPLASAAEWADAFRQAGRTLGSAARRGTLRRGLREVVSYLVIFHWNRLGLPARTQSILAWAARSAILDTPAATAGPAASPPAGSAQQVTLTAAAEAAADLAMRRFPLVLQGRRRCADLEARVREVRQFADTCQNPAEPEDRIDRACSVWNLAALIAADCGLPDLAVELCERQFQIFHAAWPVSGRTAIASLQPLVNLARLTSRAGDPEGAYRALHAIDQAARHGGNATIHGTSIPFDEFIATDGDRSELDRWLQVLLREDGTRALAAAGKWTEATEHAEQHDEAEEMLRESRQTRVIAYASNGRVDDALRLIDSSVMTEPHEYALAACLRSYAHLKDGRLSVDDVAATLAAVRLARKPTDRSTTLFCIRLGLTALDLCMAAQQVETDPLCAELIEDAERSTDAYAARELLNHATCRTRMTAGQAGTLQGLMDRAGLDAGSIPKSLLGVLMASVETAGTVLAQTLSAPTPSSAASGFSRS
ncbi:thiopeptide-type bacteriocin biosynthesis domain-containing protein [Lentzea albidocapillata]|uniref:Thiopeptide-type bacteriocin biosynthesis domain-containing protein n=1 Tax=Lentzea albidocapillata TaxID=40571 RepID=A0A1W2FPW0_9PSEU|nr:thiopeptide-type bacteriocin biosynthesis domain-containing protein [Lentzea albidocapillata]